jgi:large subunit ribosomal protein L40e
MCSPAETIKNQYHLCMALSNHSNHIIKEKLSMARFPEAEAHILHTKICMRCNARNPIKATRCRKCKSKQLRMKSKESRSA